MVQIEHDAHAIKLHQSERTFLNTTSLTASMSSCPAASNAVGDTPPDVQMASPQGSPASSTEHLHPQLKLDTPIYDDGHFRFKDLPRETRDEVYKLVIGIDTPFTTTRRNKDPNRWAIFRVDRQLNQEVTAVFKDHAHIRMPIVVARAENFREYWTYPQLRAIELSCRHITLQLSMNSLRYRDTFDALERKLKHAILPTSIPRPETHRGKRWITIEIDEAFWWLLASKMWRAEVAADMESWERCMQLMERGNPDYDFVWTIKTALLPWLAEPEFRQPQLEVGPEEALDILMECIRLQSELCECESFGDEYFNYRHRSGPAWTVQSFRQFRKPSRALLNSTWCLNHTVEVRALVEMVKESCEKNGISYEVGTAQSLPLPNNLPEATVDAEWYHKKLADGVTYQMVLEHHRRRKSRCARLEEGTGRREL
ncbi:hypothetical protein BU16DRAFT_530451 [Lophium mytilinum]|uniref:Uncharacterized protein n=1 Tax=Lophium mytilinum TaxID=390894 RepID=A0A6A6QEN4_9PEZI|nr:hypothetical protein BU16DRAFT_530451 [Lophium mytilinum]